jgi:hypothetical protein
VKRPLLLGLLLGLANGLVAMATLYAIYRLSEPVVFGYFGSVPEAAVYDSYFPWEYVALPAVLVVLNMILLALTFRRGWLRRQVPLPARGTRER